MSAPLLLLDGASMWFRSYFGVPSSITAPDGRPVNALRGFLDAVATLITQQRPARLVVCLDATGGRSGGSTSSRRTRRTASPSPNPTGSPTSKRSPMTSPRRST